MNDAIELPDLRDLGAIGQPLRRKEDERLLTARGRFSDDFSLPGEGYAAIVRSPYPHARILGIDTRRAAAMPGVLAVLTGCDCAADGLKPIPHKPVPQTRYDVKLTGPGGGPIFIGPQMLLPADRVRHVSEAVATSSPRPQRKRRTPPRPSRSITTSCRGGRRSRTPCPGCRRVVGRSPRQRARRLGLPVKVVVYNNGALGFIELEQKANGFLDFGTDFKNPNFAAIAQAHGIRGMRLEDAADVESGVAAALAHDGPVTVDAVVNRQELAMPPAVTVEMAKDFSLFMVKAVLSGRANELIELARSNFWR